MAEKLTSLWDDGSGSNYDYGPAEFAFEMLDDLLANLSVGNDWSEGNLDKETLGLWAISLFVFNQFSTVDEDLTQMLLQVGIVHF